MKLQFYQFWRCFLLAMLLLAGGMAPFDVLLGPTLAGVAAGPVLAAGCITNVSYDASTSKIQVTTSSDVSGVVIANPNDLNNGTTTQDFGGSSSPSPSQKIWTLSITDQLKSAPKLVVYARTGSNNYFSSPCGTQDVTATIDESTPGPTGGDLPPTAGGTPPTSACDDANSTACKKAQCQVSQGMAWVEVLGNQCIGFNDFFSNLFGYITMLAAIIAAFVFAVGAYNYLASRGDPSKITEGRELITNAVIGLILIGIAVAVVKFLNGAFQTVDGGINLLGPFIK